MYFCRACGAGLPPHRRLGEGTCPVCDPPWLPMAEKNTILRVKVGSEAYGLADEGGSSDRDERGVCIESLESHLGLSQFDGLEYRTASIRTGQKDAKSGPGDLDLVIYPLRKFVQLALKGNPNIVEMLFIKEHLKGTNALGSTLQSLAPHIVSRQAGKAYLGYMQTQRRKIGYSEDEEGVPTGGRKEYVEKYGYDVKFAMHLLRLGYQGIELLRTGSITLPIKEDLRTQLRAVREGRVPVSEVLGLAEDLEKELRSLLGTSPVREWPDYKLVEDWMIERYWFWWKSQRILVDRLDLTGRIQ
jgi:predicted nucleotidyltransferase